MDRGPVWSVRQRFDAAMLADGGVDQGSKLWACRLIVDAAADPNEAYALVVLPGLRLDSSAPSTPPMSMLFRTNRAFDLVLDN